MSAMNTYSPTTAKTQYVDAGSTRYAYRRIGTQQGIPLVLVHRFRATIDWWDPAFIEALTQEREVILFDNVGIGYTEGAPMSTVEAYASGTVAFIEALGLPQVDLLGWSFGGVVVQGVVLQRPELVRKLIVAGSGSGSAPGMPAIPERVANIMVKPGTDPKDALYLFYPETPAAQAKGVEHFTKIAAGMPPNAPAVSQEAALGQLAAITASLSVPWEQVAANLKKIMQPVLYANGAHDVMIDAFASYAAVQELPNAKLVLYSDAGHAFLFQHLEDFSAEVNAFLRG
ncbi:alpha/beta fold hydrolase [Massilia antarctica]|uniref:alpha/beta fold hydrolase n=1 Tax=Massilia antarctica TaxID=2765360 RepID=UPI0006BD75C0|nr:alpha/beta hydrolase [Massilia sp. H27-R4]MCY0914817.1 alpha/beta hydrolase [Massilia sp. H27-R4]CUI08143.1 Hydrolase, alpha/beta fold family [Janthinobacterium sp. CG23_2]CUU31929.1 Hydrolase, alpha/beta fold family [Janthinobacterium sp. CG23_2]